MRAVVALGIVTGTVLCGPVAAWATTPFDGSYRGDSKLASGGGQCPAGRTFSVRVTDGSFSWAIGSSETAVKIGADGGFSAQNGRYFLQGKAENGMLSAQSRGAACTYNWSLQR